MTTADTDVCTRNVDVGKQNIDVCSQNVDVCNQNVHGPHITSTSGPIRRRYIHIHRRVLKNVDAWFTYIDVCTTDVDVCNQPWTFVNRQQTPTPVQGTSTYVHKTSTLHTKSRRVYPKHPRSPYNIDVCNYPSTLYAYTSTRAKERRLLVHIHRRL